jgi:GTPase SAR1 family protein
MNRVLWLKLCCADVGKSQMQLRFNGDPYVEGYHGTLGYIGHIRKTVDVEGLRVKLQVTSLIFFSNHVSAQLMVQIWDTSGEGRRLRMFDAYYRGAHAFLVLYDISDRVSSTHTFLECFNFFESIVRSNLSQISGTS